MSVINDSLSQVKLGEPQVYQNLSMFPLIARETVEPNYRILDDELAQGCARVTEVSASGSVPELLFVNVCECPVLLLDGEELIGAKQNRILNLTVLAPANQDIVIPVSCVEQGRWHAESAEFSSAERTHYAAGRARQAANMTASLCEDGFRDGGQVDIWDDISEKAARMEGFSDTGASAAMYETHRARLEEYLKAFTAAENQSGALFAINGAVVGLDLFDSPKTLSDLLSKLVQSYALDAIDAGVKGAQFAPADAARLIEETAQARTERFKAIGEGEDLRVQGENLAGGALIVDERIVHLCVFRLQNRDHGEGSRLARASVRGRTRHWE